MAFLSCLLVVKISVSIGPFVIGLSQIIFFYSLDSLLRIANSYGRHGLLHLFSSRPVSRLKSILGDTDGRRLRHSD